jgi:hypothetical protein
MIARNLKPVRYLIIWRASPWISRKDSLSKCRINAPTVALNFISFGNNRSIGLFLYEPSYGISGISNSLQLSCGIPSLVNLDPYC